jgi:acyl carrier protein
MELEDEFIVNIPDEEALLIGERAGLIKLAPTVKKILESY